ncbi:hypothetical protein KIW74_gp20 [Mycobacterium phage Kimona]|uniref:Uncharacterized protein n=1 Tax=Mycobacterium phage Kimona TaxID=2024295 RepID=A0A249XU61_9CAUD|nr:hypothetical protein KIW74_gp20 [Mycobacterium phage Kimona]ASZ75508.1 hypothetical protein PBI_KIMONA_72 [Mycobacterium phage Kimona]
MEFVFGGMRFQCLHLPTQNRVQLWLRHHTQQWEFGHAKPVPEGMDPATVANIMRQFIVGEIDHAEYNRILPG